jgi:hypothetical protein
MLSYRTPANDERSQLNGQCPGPGRRNCGEWGPRFWGYSEENCVAVRCWPATVALLAFAATAKIALLAAGAPAGGRQRGARGARGGGGASAATAC